jgi:glycosyltransferase involved in cell wall biosynthesis
MRIVHFAPFAPNGCGLYEAARDMVVADLNQGHDSKLVDTGIFINGECIGGQGRVDLEDTRSRSSIRTHSPLVARDADVLIAHTGAPDPWYSVCQAPLIWMLHGRPQACFRPEQYGNGSSFSLMANIAEWPRTKAMISFWPYHRQFWSPIIPDHKLFCFDAPPVDCMRFSPDGPRHDFGVMGGKVNVILADSRREDVDLYEITNGAIAFARANHGVKFHFYAMEEPLRCWEYMIRELKTLGALGEVWARRPNMEEVFRAADVVLSPHRITTRVIAEALCCGTPVIAADGCVHATWTCRPDDPESVSSAIEAAVGQYKEVGSKVSEVAKEFSLSKYSLSMESVFDAVL